MGEGLGDRLFIYSSGSQPILPLGATDRAGGSIPYGPTAGQDWNGSPRDNSEPSMVTMRLGERR